VSCPARSVTHAQGPAPRRGGATNNQQARAPKRWYSGRHRGRGFRPGDSTPGPPCTDHAHSWDAHRDERFSRCRGARIQADPCTFSRLERSCRGFAQAAYTRSLGGSALLGGGRAGTSLRPSPAVHRAGVASSPSLRSSADSRPPPAGCSPRARAAGASGDAGRGVEPPVRDRNAFNRPAREAVRALE